MYNTPVDAHFMKDYQFLFTKGSKIERRLLINKGTIIGKYEVEECIGRGGYGDVYGCVIPGETKFYSIKLEDKISEKNKDIESTKLSFNKEIMCIKELHDSLDIPRFYDSGETDRYLYYVMELLGPSLSTIRKEMKF